MKLFIMFVVVALLAAMCSAQPVDSSAPEQLATSGVQRFKRQAILLNGTCPSNFARINGKCVHCDVYEDATGRDCPGRLRRKGSKKYD